MSRIESIKELLEREGDVGYLSHLFSGLAEDRGRGRSS